MLTARGKEALDETVNGITASGGKAIGIVADSSDPAAPQQVFAGAIEEFGQVDIMVNNAGFGDMVPIEEATSTRSCRTRSSLVKLSSRLIGRALSRESKARLGVFRFWTRCGRTWL